MSSTSDKSSYPSTTTPNPPRPKLRASCDECGAAKVKCDRDRPSCQRCLSLGVECIYGVCRKVGKPKKARVPTASSSSGRLPTPTFTGMDSGFWAFDPFWDPAVETAGMHTPLELDLDDLAESTFCTGSNGPPASGPSYSPMMYMPMPTPSSLPDSSQLIPSALWSCSTNGSGSTCFHQALEILSSLRSDGPKSSSSDPQQSMDGQLRPMPLDQVLSLSRSAVKKMGPLLSCPCAQMPHITLLLASVLACIVDWYQSAIDMTASHLFGASARKDSWAMAHEPQQSPFDGLQTNDGREDSIGSQDHQRSASDLSASDVGGTLPEISIGKFNIDDRQVQALVRTQLLSAEIKRLGQLVGQFGALQASFHALDGPNAGNTRRNLHKRVAFWLRDAHGALANMTRFRLQEMEASELS